MGLPPHSSPAIRRGVRSEACLFASQTDGLEEQQEDFVAVTSENQIPDTSISKSGPKQTLGFGGVLQ